MAGGIRRAGDDVTLPAPRFYPYPDRHRGPYVRDAHGLIPDRLVISTALHAAWYAAHDENMKGDPTYPASGVGGWVERWRARQ